MKKLLPVLMALTFLAAACGAADKDIEPTPPPIPAATILPSPTPTLVLPSPTATPVDDPKTEAGTERISPTDGMTQIFIPEGSFRMGGLDVKAETDEIPDRQVSISNFWMDKLEVTNAMYMLCVQQNVCKTPILFRSEKREKYFNTEEYVDYPVIYITWNDANDYCAWAGRRLPTEAEWERAARGDDFRTFPWGDERPDTSRANFNRNSRDVSRVGSFPSGASPYGILDMAGNVWEWVADFYDPNYYSLEIDLNPTGPLIAPGIRSQRHVIRGGSYQDVEADIRVSNRGHASGADPDAALDSAEYHGETSSKIGFRCASDN